LGGLAFAVLQSMVAPALPTIAADLNASTSDVSWVLTAYLLSASVLTPVLGRLGDMVGKRRVLLAVLGLLAVGTLMAALAPNLPVLIAARAVQGAAGAILPLSISIVRDELPRERVSVIIGLLSAMVGAGAGVGIVAAGPIVDHLSWHWLFWSPLIVIGIALLGTALGVPESRVRTAGRLDVLGAAILAVSLVSLLLAVSRAEDGSWAGIADVSLLAVGVLGTIAFVQVERRVREPLISIRLASLRGVWVTNLVSLLLGFAMFGTFLLVPTLLQLPAAYGHGFGTTVTQAGLLLLPTTLMMLVAGPLAGLLVRRAGPRLPMLLGATAVLAAFLLLTGAHDAVWHIIVSGLLAGAGIGLAFAAMPNAIIGAVPADHTGEATGVNAIARTVGSSVGTAVIAVVLSAGTGIAGAPSDHAFTVGFAACAGVAAIAMLATLILPRTPQRPASTNATGRTPGRVPT
jgi:EmrB/QacA subfamily drug resistance transporter